MREPARLAIISGPRSGQIIPLAQSTTVLGRAATCHVVIEDDFASRRHAQITLRDDLYWLRDLGSKNGTLLDGQPVTGETLLPGDGVVQIGDVCFRFHDPAATATHPAVQATISILQVDPAARQVWVHGQLLAPPLSTKQFDLLLYLWQRANQAVSKDEIAAAVWPEAGGMVYDYQVDKMVSRLRERLRVPGQEGPSQTVMRASSAEKDEPETRDLIDTVRGYGYRLTV